MTTKNQHAHHAHKTAEEHAEPVAVEAPEPQQPPGGGAGWNPPAVGGSTSTYQTTSTTTATYTAFEHYVKKQTG